jgi:hypothetical protein
MKKIAFLIFMLQIAHQLALAQLVTYKAPKGSLLNADFTVKVRQRGQDWQPLSIYLAKVAMVVNTRSIIENTSFSYFDCSGEVEVLVVYNKGLIKEAKIRPLSSGVVPIVTRNTISFFLTGPRNLSIEVNGDIFHNLQLFANPIETLQPSPYDSSVIYYGPGIHRVGTVTVPSNKTVYIAGGAIVQGQLLINKAENVRILGRGILTQLTIWQNKDKTSTNAVKSNIKGSRNDELTINFSKNVEVNGIIVMPHKYSILVGQSQQVKISNIKSFSSEGNADGIDVFCSSDIAINQVFMRNADDCVAIYGHRWSFYGNTKNITVSNSILWADVAHPVLIGTHGDTQNPDTLGNMKFENIDILDQHENQIDYQGCLALNSGDSNLIEDIRFDNIRIDDIRKGQLFNIRVMFNHMYNTSPGMGIQNVYFKNISYTGKNANLSLIAGYDDMRRIRNLTFENLNINGKVIEDNMPGKPGFYKTSDMAGIFIGEHVEGVRFLPLKGNSNEKAKTN